MKNLVAISIPLSFIIVFLTIFGLMMYDINRATNLCESKGYGDYHYDTEKGYIACCNPIIKDHIKTDESECEAFKYKWN